MNTQTKETLFQGLESLYKALEGRLSSAADNPCGQCRACCTASGVDRQSLTALELDFIAHKVGPEKMHAFDAYTRRLKDSTGEFLFEVCPYYDLNDQGCSIYEHRPFSCRAFGHYRLEGTRLPQDCVFEGHEREVKKGRAYQEIPLAKDLQELARDFWAHTGPRLIGHATEIEQSSDPTPRLETNESGDLVSKALIALARGENEEAIEQLEKLEGSEPFRLHHLGLALTGLERHEEANRVFVQCLPLAPNSWELSYHLALNLHTLGDEQGAFHFLVRTTELNPLHALAWCLLGYMSLQAGFEAEARRFLARGLELDPENEKVRARLEMLMSAQ